MDLILGPLTMVVSIITSIVPKPLDQTVIYLYNFVTSTTQWVGYLIGALYYMGEDFGYATYMCQISGYAGFGVFYLNMVVTFGAMMQAGGDAATASSIRLH